MGNALTLMLAEQPVKAAPLIDRRAEIYVDHLGNWVTAGWAYFAQGDMAAARRQLKHALAVMDVVESSLDSARRRAGVALQLDRERRSAALPAACC